MARQFGEHVERRLMTELGKDEGKKVYAFYTTVRDRVVKDIFKEIKGVQPDLSDHGEDHVDNVLHNARKLIGGDARKHGLNAVELYCLSMFILFHDVGNLFGRENHHKHVAEVYDWCVGDYADLRHERTLIVKAAMAHTGTASDGMTCPHE